MKTIKPLGCRCVTILGLFISLVVGFVTAPSNSFADPWWWDLEVNSTVDEVDVNPGNCACATAMGACTLRAAVMEANAVSVNPKKCNVNLPIRIVLPDPTTLNPPAVSYLLLAGSLNVTGNYAIWGSSGLVKSAINAQKLNRVFDIGPNNETAGLTLDNIIVQNGKEVDNGGCIRVGKNSKVDLGNSDVNNCETTNVLNGQGGGIWNAGILNVGDVNRRLTSVRSNKSTLGGGIYNDATGKLHVFDSAVIGDEDVNIVKNTASLYGGGIFNTIGGEVTIDKGGSVLNNTAVERGGGIYSTNGRIIITGDLADPMHPVKIEGNKSKEGGGIYFINGTVNKILQITEADVNSNSAVDGGGIYFFSTEDLGSLTKVNVTSNTAYGNGGGLYLKEGEFDIKESSITLNKASSGGDGYGAGIYNHKADLFIENTTIDSNEFMNTQRLDGAYGGGIYNFNENGMGHLTITNSSITRNGVARSGGGIYQKAGKTALNNVTVGANEARTAGGGILNEAGDVILNNVTVAYNDAYGHDVVAPAYGGGIKVVAGNVYIKNTLIAHNNDADGKGGQLAPDCYGTLLSAKHNIIQWADKCTLNQKDASDITGNFPVFMSLFLDPNLKKNGGLGLTENYAIKDPVFGGVSILIDAGEANPEGLDKDGNPFPLDFDQRGMPKAGNRDIGAYEYQPVCGDFIVQNYAPFDEECDDGNTVDDKNGCDAACKKNAVCGNNVTEALFEVCDGTDVGGFTCDDPNLNAWLIAQGKIKQAFTNKDPIKCAVNCQDIDVSDCYSCGDGVVNGAGGEKCDPADPKDPHAAHCKADCSGYDPFCSDGHVDAGIGEDCDDGNTLPGDCCNAMCKFEPNGSICNDNNPNTIADACDGAGKCVGKLCGNGQVDLGEDCELGVPFAKKCEDLGKGFTAGTLSCDAAGTCMFDTTKCTTCGNNIMEPGEDCDDGKNGNNKDGCTDACRFTCIQPADCDDSDACNGAETCDVAQHTCQAGIAVKVDDGDPCTVDTCAGGKKVNTPVNVDDNDLCTTDSCDPKTGKIDHIPVNKDDNDLCTTDSCDPIAGVKHDTVSTDDNNVCTTDSCDPATGKIAHVKDPACCLADNECPQPPANSCRMAVCEANKCVTKPDMNDPACAPQIDEAEPEPDKKPGGDQGGGQPDEQTGGTPQEPGSQPQEDSSSSDSGKEGFGGRLTGGACGCDLTGRGPTVAELKVLFTEILLLLTVLGFVFGLRRKHRAVGIR